MPERTDLATWTFCQTCQVVPDQVDSQAGSGLARTAAPESAAGLQALSEAWAGFAWRRTCFVLLAQGLQVETASKYLSSGQLAWIIVSCENESQRAP